MTSPYRIAPARAPRRKRSALRRIWAAARFPPPPDIASFRPTFMVIQTIAAICAYLAGWYLPSALLGASVVLATSPTFDVLRVLWRLRRARKTIRLWSTRCDHRGDGCHTCGGATFAIVPPPRIVSSVPVTVETTSRGLEVTYEITIETGADARRGRTG